MYFCQCYQLPQCDERYYCNGQYIIDPPTRSTSQLERHLQLICSTKNKVCRFHHEVDGRCECGDLLSFFDVRSTDRESN